MLRLKRIGTAMCIPGHMKLLATKIWGHDLEDSCFIQQMFDFQDWSLVFYIDAEIAIASCFAVSSVAILKRTFFAKMNVCTCSKRIAAIFSIF